MSDLESEALIRLGRSWRRTFGPSIRWGQLDFVRCRSRNLNFLSLLEAKTDLFLLLFPIPAVAIVRIKCNLRSEIKLLPFQFPINYSDI